MLTLNHGTVAFSTRQTGSSARMTASRHKGFARPGSSSGSQAQKCAVTTFNDVGRQRCLMCGAYLAVEDTQNKLNAEESVCMAILAAFLHFKWDGSAARAIASM